MNPEYENIELYLNELQFALRGQSPALISDALYDARCHIEEALSESHTTTVCEVVEQYGSPQDIAAYYIKMEADAAVLMQGPKRTTVRFNGFFEPLSNINDYQTLAYFFVSMPLSILYFAWTMLVGVPSLLLSVVGIGLPVLWLFLRVQSFVGLFEGQLINALLNVRMPRRPAMVTVNQSPKRIFWATLLASSSWKRTLYTLIHFPLCAIYFALGCVLFVGSIALMASPIIDPIIHFVWPQYQVDLQWYWFPLTMVAGLIGITIALYASRALKVLHIGVANYLLMER